MSSKTFHRKLRKFKKIPEMLEFDVEFPAVHPVAKFRGLLEKNWKKSALKNSTEN